MRTAAAYISKIKGELLGKTYKVQDANHRLFTTTLYRGAARCGPVDYTQLDYIEPCRCEYIGLSIIAPICPPIPPPPKQTIIDGGSPSNSGIPIIDGGNPSTAVTTILDGGKP